MYLELVRCSEQQTKERLAGIQRSRDVLRVVLSTNEVRMVGHLDDLHTDSRTSDAVSSLTKAESVNLVKKIIIRLFSHLHQSSAGLGTAVLDERRVVLVDSHSDKEQTLATELRHDVRVDLVAVTMTLIDDFLIVQLAKLRVLSEEGSRALSETHRSAQTLLLDIVLRHVDDNLKLKKCKSTTL